MNTKIIPYVLVVLLTFSLTITGCTASEKPAPENNTTTPQNTQNNTNTTKSEMQNNTATNEQGAPNNVAPNQPGLTTPNSTVGFTLDQLKEFELDIELTNKDKVDMLYKKGPSNEESRVETVLDGKKSNANHEEASRQIEELLAKIPGESISNANKIIEGTLSALKITREDVTEFDMEFIFESGEKVNIEFNK